jgi:hypothetical protein
MTVVMGLLIGVAVAFGLVLAFVRAVAWAKETRATRFVFEDRDTYLLLKVDRPLGDGESALVTMRALREALHLKLAGFGYERILVDASGLRIANAWAFWFLIGALGPALADEKVKLAVVCRRGTLAAQLFHESGVLNALPSVREGERYLHSAEPRQHVAFDPEELNALLVPGQRRAA